MKPKRLVADPQYSSQSLRDAALKQGTVPVIPYPRNQKRGVKGILRIDRKFKSHGPKSSEEPTGNVPQWNECSADSRTSQA